MCDEVYIFPLMKHYRGFEHSYLFKVSLLCILISIKLKQNKMKISVLKFFKTHCIIYIPFIFYVAPCIYNCMHIKVGILGAHTESPQKMFTINFF